MDEHNVYNNSMKWERLIHFMQLFLIGIYGISFFLAGC